MTWPSSNGMHRHDTGSMLHVVFNHLMPIYRYLFYILCIYIYISQAGSLRHYSKVGWWTLQKQRSTFDRCHGEKTLESEPLANSGAIWCPKGVVHVFWEYIYIYIDNYIIYIFIWYVHDTETRCPSCQWYGIPHANHPCSTGQGSPDGTLLSWRWVSQESHGPLDGWVYLYICVDPETRIYIDTCVRII